MNLLLDGSMSLIAPKIGLLFWTTLIFLTLWFILGKYAFKPIAKALKDREEGIADSLAQADKARKEMELLKSDNDRIMRQATEEKSRILKEAKDMSNQMIDEAKTKAKEEANKIVEQAKTEINTQKALAIAEVKNMIGNETISLTEKLLKRELADRAAQQDFIAKEVKGLSF